MTEITLKNLDLSAVEGLHVYALAGGISLAYASPSFREMTGYESGEFAAILHPGDAAEYSARLTSIAEGSPREQFDCRIIRRGEVRHIRCTLNAGTWQNAPAAIGIAADITSLKQENSALQRINETVPCGILKYTCDLSPRVTYINDQMLRILRFDGDAPGAPDMLSQYENNIYLMIPPEERERFRRFLNLVYTQDKPIAGEITAFRFDGSRVRLFGWISKHTNDAGEEEYQTVCMDATERYERKRRAEEQRYIGALSQVYDEIFDIDFAANTGRFIHGRYAAGMGAMASMPMMLDDTVNFWINNVVHEGDREHLRQMFAELKQREAMGAEGGVPLQTEFRALHRSGAVSSYMGLFLKTGPAGYLFCCRNITPQRDAARLQQENDSLRNFTEHMQELITHFTDGMLAFEIKNHSVRPLYFSENICRFFGYTKEEWLGMMNNFTPIESFVSRCHIPYETFLELLEGSQSEFRFTDVASDRLQRIKAVRTRGVSDPDSYYVLLYDITSAENAPVPEKELSPRVQIRTFGYFDVFVDGKPIAFRNEKAKELCALLVDRRGGFITSGEALSVLWEDEPATPVTQARYRKVALRLKNTLEEYGVSDIIESIDGKRRIIPERVECDLYRYLAGDPRYAQAFKGSYLQNYSWSENTLAELEG